MSEEIPHALIYIFLHCAILLRLNKMGGQAFASHGPPLKTPRMTQEVYDQVFDQTQAILRKFYSKVESAIEGPGKITYGDVDILVALPLKSAFPSEGVEDTLKEALNASASRSEKGNPTINFAIPWPDKPTTDASDISKEGEGDTLESRVTASEKRYVQVDVHICKHESEFDWQLFHSAHGDLWNIIGSTIRKFGLTINNRAFFIRIPEIELNNRRKSMVFLTDDPTKILNFLGLDQGRWWKRFDTQQEMFEYAATCRMFWVEGVVKDEEEEEEDAISASLKKDQVSGEVEKKKLKHNDRQRLRKRPIFKAWFDEFIPRCCEEGKHSVPKITREEIRDEVFEEFNVKEEYESKRLDWNLERNIVEVVNDGIKGSIPMDVVDGQIRSAATKVLRGIIVDGDPYEGKVPEAAMKDENGFYNLKLVKCFVTEHWENAGRIGMARQKIKAIEAMKAKAEKKAKAEQEHGLQRMA